MDRFDPATSDALPIGDAPAEPAVPPAILVVDDELHVGQIVCRLLQEILPQHEIIAVTDPTAALEQLRWRKVALMITDFSMPVHDGIQLTTYVKGQSPHTQVMLMTAHSTAILRRVAQDQGVDYYLPKPFQLIDLENLVSVALTNYEAYTSV